MRGRAQPRQVSVTGVKQDECHWWHACRQAGGHQGEMLLARNSLRGYRAHADLY